MSIFGLKNCCIKTENFKSKVIHYRPGGTFFKLTHLTGCNKKNGPPDQNMIPFLTVFLSNLEIFDRNSQEKVFWYKVGVQNDCQNCKKMW